MDRKLTTDNEIIKALECCVKDDILEANNNVCLECPINDDNACTFNLRKHTLDLITRQKAEIEELVNASYKLKERVLSQKKALFEQQSYTAELQNKIGNCQCRD